MLKDRQSSLGIWVPGLFATFWILLAAFSGAYMFRIVTEPRASGSETAQADTAPAVEALTPPLSAEQAAALISANEAKDKQITELRTALNELSQQVTEVNTRLKPIEKMLGPVAALPTGNAVTTSPPSPDAEAPLEKTPEPVKPGAKSGARPESGKASAKPPEPAKPAEKLAAEAKSAEKPADAAKPTEKPSEQAKAEETASDTAKPAEKPAEPVKPAEKPAAQAKAAEKPPEPTKPTEKPADQAKAAEKPAEPAKPTDKPAEVASKPAEVASAEDTAPVTSAPSDSSAPAPADAASQAAAPAETANLSAPIPIPPGTMRFGIEIGSVDKQDALRSLWKDLLSNHAALVAGLQAKRVLAPDKKWRLVAGPFPNVAEATQACGLFKKANLPCDPTVFAGDAF